MKNIYKIFLNSIIIILVIVGIGILGYLLYDNIHNMILTKEAEAAVDEFMKSIEQDNKQEINQNVEEKNVVIVDIDEQNQIIENTEVNSLQSQTTTNTQSTKTTQTYRNFNIVGSIQIPKTKIKYPIVDTITPDAVAVAVTQIYGPGLNEIGNTVLVAHNYRNGTFFSNNKKLVNGDKIYITDSNGLTVEYTIYNTYLTPESDFSYATRNTNGKREISLSTCTNDNSKRLVIWAKE